MRTALALCIALVACDSSTNTPAPNPPTPVVAKKQVTKPPLKARIHAEDRVACPAPTDAQKCDPAAPQCAAGDYCLAAGDAAYCGPCPERDAIRHRFELDDFSVDASPFKGGNPEKSDHPKVVENDGPQCGHPPDAFSYADVKVIGVLREGMQRKALAAALGGSYVLKKGDCIGSENARVADIGPTFVSLRVPSGKGSVEYSIAMPVGLDSKKFERDR